MAYLHSSLSVQLLYLHQLLPLIIVAHRPLDWGGWAVSDAVPELLFWQQDFQLCLALSDPVPGVVKLSEFIELLC